MTKQRKELVTRELFKALSYSDIFNYPLTGDQLWNFMGVEITRKEFFYGLSTIPHQIFRNTIYYFLPRRGDLIQERVRKEKISKEKLQQAISIAKFLGRFPTIQFVGISGSLALKNADRNDDSDLFFITLPHAVWITRLFVYFYLIFSGRKRKNKKNGNAICANMFLDIRAVTFSAQKRNMYIAHEIMQLLPVVNKNNTYEMLLSKNRWLATYFPNFKLPKNKNAHISRVSALAPIELLLRALQQKYMQHKQTRETTTAALIAFHPIDYESMTLKAYERKIRKYAV